MRHLQHIVLSTALALSAISCIKGPETVEVRALAGAKEVYDIGRIGGDVRVQIYASGPLSVSVLPKEHPWATLDRVSLDGDGEITVTAEVNSSFRRMLALCCKLKDGGLRDTVYVRQEGAIELLSCPQPYKSVPGANASTVEFELTTNVDVSAISSSVGYLSADQDWISKCEIRSGKLEVSLAPNTGENSRRAGITLSYVNGWGQVIGCELYITQFGASGSIGSDVDFATVRSRASEQGLKVEQDWILSGVVISDRSSLNMEENPQTAYDDIDTTASLRTAYIQNSDGSKGFRLVFDESSNNNLTAGTAVTLDLIGATVLKENDPERYTISGLSGFNVLKAEPGARIPVKRRTISTLTDDDVYTYVTLMDTEFAFKGGSYCDIYEKYTFASSVNTNTGLLAAVMDGWAGLLVDKDGSAIYAPVNSLCAWRRDGNGVPQGTGATQGIIVHNELPRLGDPGRYQIRVLDVEGFAQSSFGGLSTYACWNHNPTTNYGSVNPRYQYKGVHTVFPSDDIVTRAQAAAELTIELPENAKGASVSSCNYFSGKNASNYGIRSGVNGMLIMCDSRDWYKWEGNAVSGYNGLLLRLSTRTVSGSGIFVYYDMMGGYTDANYMKTYPAHWCVEWSVDGGENWTAAPDPVSGKPYVHLRSMPYNRAYVGGFWYNTSRYAGQGFGQHVCMLPSAALGQDELLVRIRPYDDVVASIALGWDDDPEDNRIIAATDFICGVRFGNISIMYR